MTTVTKFPRRDTALVQPRAETRGQIRALAEERDEAAAEVDAPRSKTPNCTTTSGSTSSTTSSKARA